MTTHQDAPDGQAPGSAAGTFQGFSLPEAARLLGVSRSSVRRMIQDGRLEGRRVLRPQGYAWEVRIPSGSAEPDVDTHHAPGPGRVDAPPGGSGATGAEALGAWLVPVLTPILAPIVAELQATRAAGERKDAIIRDQAETIGRQGAELEAARAADLSRRRDARRLTIAAAVLAALALAAVAAPAWVR